MKVLHVISSGGMYGAEAVILQLTAGMETGHHGQSSLAVFAHTGHGRPELHEVALSSGFHSELIPCKGQLDLTVPAALRELASRVQADVVHTHGYKADIYAYLAFRGKVRPSLVSTCHTWYDNDRVVRLYGTADRWVLRHFDQVVAVSADVKGRLLKAGVAETRIHLIRNGVTIPDRDSASEAAPADRQHSLHIGLVGRLAPEKGIDVFLRAIALLGDRLRGATATIAGDGPERASLEKLRTELGLDQVVAMAGQQKEMDAFYASLDIQVSASRHEGLPMALLEGMARGLPIVATCVGEVPEVVVPQETGFLVNPDSPEALAQAVEQLMSDAALRGRFGRAGRERVQQHFSAARMTTEYVSVYELAMASRRATTSRVDLRNEAS